MITDNKLKKTINLFADKEEISTVFLYGSYGTEFQNENSDIDFAILYTSPLSMLEELALAADIEHIMGREIDLVSLNKANVLLKYNIVKTGTKIYEKDFIVTANFIESLLKEYFDFGMKLRRLKLDFHQSLKEEYEKNGR